MSKTAYFSIYCILDYIDNLDDSISKSSSTEIGDTVFTLSRRVSPGNSVFCYLDLPSGTLEPNVYFQIDNGRQGKRHFIKNFVLRYLKYRGRLFKASLA